MSDPTVAPGPVCPPPRRIPRDVASTLPDATRPHDPPAPRRYTPPAGIAGDTGGVAAQLHGMLRAGELDLPLPGAGTPPAMGGAGRLGKPRPLGGPPRRGARRRARDPRRGRSPPAPGALYGVWASRSGGAAGAGRTAWILARAGGDDAVLLGRAGADRALVVADPPGEPPSDRRLLLDVDVTVGGVEALPDTWCTTAMADADTLDVVFDDVAVTDDALVGEPGWYVDRPGFALGGAGVAAVWWGGAEGMLDRALPTCGVSAGAGRRSAPARARRRAARRARRRGGPAPATATAVDAAPAADHALAVGDGAHGRRARCPGGGGPGAPDRRAGSVEPRRGARPRAGRPGALRPPAPRRARPCRAGRSSRRPVARRDAPRIAGAHPARHTRADLDRGAGRAPAAAGRPAGAPPRRRRRRASRRRDPRRERVPAGAAPGGR